MNRIIGTQRLLRLPVPPQTHSLLLAFNSINTEHLAATPSQTRGHTHTTRHAMQALTTKLVGRRLNPQKPQAAPWFEGWYTRVVADGGQQSFAILTGFYPEQTPKHSAAYTTILFNEDDSSQAGQLQVFESFLPQGRAPQLTIERGDTNGEQQTDFLFEHTVGVVKIAGQGPDLLYEARVGGATASFRSKSGSTPWEPEDGGGSPQGLLHLLPGLGLHWYVHSTMTRVAYDVSLPDGRRRVTGEGWAHVEKNWGGSFPRSFIWAQGFAINPPGSSSNGNGSNGGADTDGNAKPQASFCLAGGVLPTLNLDKLPLPLPDVVLLGYRSASLTWDFKPHSPTLFSNTISPEHGTLTISAQQLTRKLVLTVQAPLGTFARVAGPTRGGFVPHSVESYSATATAECCEGGELVEKTSFNRVGLEFGGSYACRLEEGAGRSTDGLVCEPQWEG